MCMCPLVGRKHSLPTAYPAARTVWICLLLMPFGTAWTESLAERSLRKLAATPMAAPDTVDFAVCTDPQPGGLLGTPRAFLDMISDWNAWRPDFIVCAGDMIMGGPPDQLHSMWDEFLGHVQRIETPFFPVPGNHDVGDDPEVLQIYRDRVGPFNYVIRRGPVACVVLNTEERGEHNGFSAEQQQWLADTLATVPARHIFLFLHVPIFAYNWARDWQPVADIIRPYPVRAVFAGHEHYYRLWDTRDGVAYVVAGIAGGSTRGTSEEEGGFFCWLAVRVRGDAWTWALVRPGSILAADVVTQATVDRAASLQNMLELAEVRGPWGEPVEAPSRVSLRNPFDTPLSVTLTWTCPPGWQVSEQTLVFHPAPGETAEHTVTVSSQGPLFFPAPVLTGRIADPVSGHPVSLTRALPYVPELAAPRAVEPVTVDGLLDEWERAPAARMMYGVAYDPADETDLTARVRVMWDEGHFDLAVETQDNEFHQPFFGDVVWMADSVEFWVDQSNWSLSLSTKGPQVFLDQRPDRHLDAVVEGIPLAVRRDGNRITYEAAFPADQLPQIRLTAGESALFSILVNDLDPSGPLEKRHYVELTPGAGEHFDCPKVRLLFQP